MKKLDWKEFINFWSQFYNDSRDRDEKLSIHTLAIMAY